MPYPCSGASSPLPHRRNSHPVLWRFGCRGRSARPFSRSAYCARRRLNPAHVWNLCVCALFAALIAQRLLLVVINLRDLRSHPSWLLTLAMVHHPLLAAFGSLAGALVAIACARWQKLPFLQRPTHSPPPCPGTCLRAVWRALAGSGYGTETSVRWAVTYTHPLAAIWSGTPLGVALHPVQAYAAFAFLILSVALLIGQPAVRRPGDLAGICLIGTGISVYITEIWRDTEGRGTLLDGALDGPQAGAVLLVLAGALLLLERIKQPMPTEVAHG